jgi:hypothetical protein
MKYIYLITIIFSIFNSYSQNKKIENKDNVTNYEMMKSGTFIQKIKHPRASPSYYMVIKDSLSIEYSENEKYYTKSKLSFKTKGNFTSVAYESTIPGYNHNIKEVIETKILETSTKDSLILIKVRTQNSKWQKTLLKKIKS